MNSKNSAAHLPALIIAACLFVSAASLARQSDLEQAIDVRADRSEFDQVAGTQTLTGNVEITQGTIKITADRILISLQNNALSRIEGSGSPIRFQQENDAGELITGVAKKISYDAISGTLILAGGATLTQPRQQLTSERIVFDSRSQKVSADGGSDAGRVSIRIQPPTPADK
ncbi:MAG: lipopolysaccharide transport periplasmic protein LptA [Granulosicoccus sp.]